MSLHVEVENFYISYSDMVTLLLIFFVYLFSISEIDPVKLMSAMSSVKQEMSGESVQSVDKMVQKLELEQKKLQEMKKEIQKFITANGLQEKVSVSYQDGQLELNMGDAVLFPTGKADLKPEALDILKRLSVMFDKSDSKIVVEGHTDDVPIQGGAFPSNWELSSSRASSVVRYMESTGVASDRFIVIGYNQFSPLEPNNSPDHRAKNRRVKVILRPDISKMVPKQKVSIAK
jgi:chemotaxis protein MotB